MHCSEDLDKAASEFSRQFSRLVAVGHRFIRCLKTHRDAGESNDSAERKEKLHIQDHL